MEKTWLCREGNEDLIIFMLGWASTPNAVCHLPLAGYDVLACHDYRHSLSPLAAEEFSAYRRILLFAWSYGIWVAEQCCRELPLRRAIALNGTPFPVHERYGMRLRAIQRRMKALALRGGTNDFNDGSQAGIRYMPAGPFAERSIEAKIEELDTLAEWSRREAGAHLHWDAALMARQDEIFPLENMRAYWQSVGLGTEMEGYHYPFARPEVVLDWL